MSDFNHDPSDNSAIERHVTTLGSKLSDVVHIGKVVFLRAILITREGALRALCKTGLTRLPI